MIYLDSSYIVRLYYEDPGFAIVRELVATAEIACSQHGRAEVIAAFHHKYRQGNITAAVFGPLVRQFIHDAKGGGFSWLNVSAAVLDRLETVYQKLPATVFLRSADALHLASAAENGFKQIYSNDEKLLDAAKYFGLKPLNVI